MGALGYVFNPRNRRLIMEMPSPSIRDLARRLLAVEAGDPSAANSRVHESVRVCEKLRVCLIRLAGPDGFTALMRRALALARAEIPSLHGITVKSDGSLEGFEALAADAPDAGIETAVAITAHLLGLMVTFIGEALTARLVREAWPDVKEVEASNARLVVVDSFRTVVRKASTNASEMELQGFVQRLALHLTSWQATTFLIGEYVEGELRDNPVFTVADGLFWLYQNIKRNSIVRKMQIMKLRGQESVLGLDTFRITKDGLQSYPRTLALLGQSDHVKGRRRLSTGIRDHLQVRGYRRAAARLSRPDERHPRAKVTPVGEGSATPRGVRKR
jgi:hypothetical protein